jgi:sulfonate transport system permease protein
LWGYDVPVTDPITDRPPLPGSVDALRHSSAEGAALTLGLVALPTASSASRRGTGLVPRPVRRLAVPPLLVGLWALASSRGWIDERSFPSPGDVVSTARSMLADGELQEHLLVSLGRVWRGLAIGVPVGLALAVVSGLSRLGEDLVDLPMQMLRAMPILALTPFIILWFGIGETPKIAYVAIATVFPVYLNTFAAIRGVDADLVEAGRVFGLRKPGLVRHVILPGATAGFLLGLRYALAIAWLVLIVAETINATSGLGFLMNQARSFYQTDVLVVGLVVYAVLGLLSDVLVRILERSALSWRRSFTGA